ncbi:MAG: SCO family protein [Bacteroidetes bacterium]|nr:MAG: SCO family protein [Bacteroidota bacterium]
MSRKTWIYIIFFALLFGGFYVFLYATIDTSKSKLPVLTNVHSFSFTRQDGKQISEKDVLGKVNVVEFFFSTCQGICPRLNHQMQKLSTHFKGQNNLLILSHTVDPTNDTVERLKNYSDSLGADINQWWFLTGEKKELYKSARENYLLDDPQNNSVNINEQFLHTQFFALVDAQGRVRGIYDGLKSDEIKKLYSDIEDLLKENK